MIISIGARSSLLSKAQTNEVLEEIRLFHPEIEFLPTWIETTGDKNLTTSLRTLVQTDFFTKEVDEMQLQGNFRLSIHSAKDLPEPPTPGLKIVALTQGLTPQDALVMRSGDTINSLKRGAKIATSSIRREEVIKSIRDNLECVDIRGTVENRLKPLLDGSIDGVVIAKAALIRLQLEHYNHILLPGNTAKFQGRLAIIAKEGDQEMSALFSCIDSRKRKKVLYLGLEMPEKKENIDWVHCPIIETSPLPVDSEKFLKIVDSTYLIMTSKMAVRYFMEETKRLSLNPKFLHKECLSVGKITTQMLENYGFTNIYTAEVETSDGIIALIRARNIETGKIFWPHSAKSSRKIANFLREKGIELVECLLYDTHPKKNFCMPALDEVEAIFFSSPSTCEAYLSLIGALPEDKTLIAQGPVTFEYLQKITTNGRLTLLSLF